MGTAMNLPGIDDTQLRQIGESTRTLLLQGKLDEAHDILMATIQGLAQRYRDVALQLLKLQKERVGKRTEKIDPAQLLLMFEEMCRQAAPALKPDPAVEDEEDADLEREIEEAKRRRDARHPKAKRRARGDVSAREVKLVVHEVPVADADKTCGRCGKPRDRIGVEVTVQLKWIPGHFERHEHRRDKYACRCCKDGVVTAPGPVKVIERSDAHASLLAQVVVSKFADHSPLHRQHRIFLRDGVDVPVSTLSDWTGAVGEILVPLGDAIGTKMYVGYVVRLDGTGVKVLDPASPENIERGTMTCYVGDDKWVRFHYTPTGEGALGPWKVLEGRRGYVQADAANLYDRLFNGKVAWCREVGCHGHSRRGFVELQDTDVRVAYPLRLYRRLYRIERLAKLKELGPEEVAALRQRRSKPILNKLKAWVDTVLRTEPPRMALAQACRYVVNHWEALTRFMSDGRLDIDNNLCEAQLRAIALGRRNFLFFGSHRAAERGAVIYSVLRTCALHGVEPVAYLTDVLQKLAEGWPSERMAELLPDRWRAAEVK
jgi:transposase